MAEPLQYTRFNDFRPGIFNRSEYALTNAGIPAPQGAAQFTNTYRCIALPSGGLAPLPRRVQTWTGPVLANVYDHGPWTVGFQAFGPINGTQSAYPDELLVGADYIDGTSHIRGFRVVKLNAWRIPYNTVTIDVVNPATANPVDQYWGMTFGTSRMLAAGPYTNPGYPVVVYDWSEPGPGATKLVRTFPDPAAPTLDAIQALANIAAQVVTHQGRVLFLQDNAYAHGVAPAAIPTNEQISFTDPPNSNLVGTQNEVFMQEYPVGYGAWGSISAGELFLVKNRGGGVIVSGDVAFPSITRLPGVVSTGTWMGKSAATPQGLFYMSSAGGVFVWRGSDTSQLVSPQLDFGTAFGFTAPILNVVSHLEDWHNWVLGSNNWVFDTDNGGWWQIEDQAVVNCRWWSRGSISRFMYGAPIGYNASTVAYTWDRLSPSLTYSWQSQPLNVNQERLMSVREIILIAQGSGTVTITLTKLDGTIQAEVFSVTKTAFPQKLRVRTYGQGYTVVFRIQADGGSNPAPVVHEVTLGWEQSVEASGT